uniref:Uncharacterized protein n=1 Tax=Timema monikensis TaxID=170555 RepID=A0A7R9EL67_9NEOP|nr:unnamed protein product [Timema monikensis]
MNFEALENCLNSDYWDQNGLDACLGAGPEGSRQHDDDLQTPPLSVSSECGHPHPEISDLEVHYVPGHLIEVVNALPPAPFSRPLAPILVSGYVSNNLLDVYDGMYVIDGLIFQMEGGKSSSILPPPLGVSPHYSTAGAPPPSQGDSNRAQAAVGQTGSTVLPQPMVKAPVGPSSAPQSEFSGPVNQLY